MILAKKQEKRIYIVISSDKMQTLIVNIFNNQYLNVESKKNKMMFFKHKKSLLKLSTINMGNASDLTILSV